MKKIVVFPMLLLLVLTIACSQQRANTPDPKDNVVNSLKANGYNDVNVDVDRDKGVVTLKGDVKTEQDKNNAEQLAKSSAPGMVIANEIGVRPEGEAGDTMSKVDKNTDDAIEDHMKAAIAANKWENQHIGFDAKNGVLTLTGDVDTAGQRQEVQKTAATIPGVQQVVNELQVKGQKESAARTRNKH
jgi:hyperosmotically inducible periplasmic protein